MLSDSLSLCVACKKLAVPGGLRTGSRACCEESQSHNTFRGWDGFEVSEGTSFPSIVAQGEKLLFLFMV